MRFCLICHYQIKFNQEHCVQKVRPKNIPPSMKEVVFLVEFTLPLLGTRGAVLHHSAETVLCFRNQVVLLSCCLVLPYQSIRAQKENLPMV